MSASSCLSLIQNPMQQNSKPSQQRSRPLSKAIPNRIFGANKSAGLRSGGLKKVVFCSRSAKNGGMNEDDQTNVPPSATPTRQKKPTLVYLDDELPNFEFLFDNFTDRFEIHKFTDGDQAWQELSNADPDVFITDIAHPGSDGWELVKRLAAKKVTYPILVVTGYNDSAFEIFCKKQYPKLNVTVITKPFGIEDILKHLTALVRD
jgi:CheY-like chemotaxis protein